MRDAQSQLGARACGDVGAPPAKAPRTGATATRNYMQALSRPGSPDSGATPPGGVSRKDASTRCGKCGKEATTKKDPIMLCSAPEACRAAAHRSCAGLTKEPAQWYCIKHGKAQAVPAESGAAARP